MKPLVRAFWVWLVLGGLSWSLATGNGGDLIGPMAAAVLLIPLAAAIWLTAIAATGHHNASFGRTVVLTVTAVVWCATLVVIQGRFEGHPDERYTLLVACGLAALLAVGIVAKTRSYPRRST